MQQKKYWQAEGKLNNPKDKKISEAIDRREKSIAAFQDKKSISIAISSAFNGATDILTALVQTGKEQWSWDLHYSIYKEYLERFATEQIDGELIYKNAMKKFVSEKEGFINNEIIKEDVIEL